MMSSEVDGKPVSVPGAAGQDLSSTSAGSRLLYSRRFWAVWAVLAALTLAVSIGAGFESRFPGDLRIERDVQSISVPFVGGLLNVENVIGSPWPAVTIIIVLTLLLILVRRWQLALLFACTNALRGAGTIVKAAVNRPRPGTSLVHVTDHSNGSSFPSGHVFSAVLLYGALAVVIEMLPLPRAVRRSVQLLCLLIVVLMGPARVYAGAHWPSDVLGGYLWGTLLLLLALAIGSRWIAGLMGNIRQS